MIVAFIIIITGFLWLFKTIDCLGVPLFLIFLILQLCGVITWSWVMVCLPLIIWVGSLLFTFICIAILAWISVEN